ncbi:MAG: alpha/beta fold hydrolase [Polyangiales bacterium]
MPRESDPAVPNFRRFTLPSGITLAADTYGSPNNTPVIFLHGGGQTRHAWGGTATKFADRAFYAVTVDMRGHGQSDWAPDGSYEPQDFANDLEELLPFFKKKPVLVGASLGGITAMTVAAKREPSDAAALVLVDVTPRVERQGVNRIIDFMRARPEGYASLEEVADAIAAYQPHRKRPADLSGLEKNLRRTEDGRYRWHWDPRVLDVWTPETFTVEEGQRIVAERMAAAARMTIPVLLVRGRLSDVVSEENAREFLDAVPHAEFVDLKDAAHMVAGDSNDRFTEVVLDFVERAMVPKRLTSTLPDRFRRGDILAGRYRLEDRLGKGGTGLVFDAFDEKMNRSVALKVLRPSYASGSVLERFKREARLAATINHPFVVPIYDYGELDDGQAYLAMAHLEGDTLAKRIEKTGPLSIEAVHKIGMQIIAAARASHAKQVIHRDIKPANVMLTEDAAILIDFGLSKSRTEAVQITVEGMVVGTPSYMAPEQLLNTTIGPATDIYAIGATLYEALTGSIALDCTDLGIAKSFERVLHDVPTAPNVLRSEIPEAMSDCLMRALQKEPADRHQSCDEFARKNGRVFVR